MKPFRCMLSAKVEEPEDFEQLRYPLMLSPKLDGIRCTVRKGEPRTRANEKIPNRYIRAMLSGLPGVDGEIVIGSPCARDENGRSLVFQNTNGPVRAFGGEPQFRLYVFDHAGKPSLPFVERLISARRICQKHPNFLFYVQHHWVHDLEHLLRLERMYTKMGYEGVMLRDPYGPYKQGRATLREGWLTKVKRFKDAEAVVVGMEPLQRNKNEATKSKLGLTKRSSKKAGQVVDPTRMGKLVCEWHPGSLPHKKYQGVQFKIGSGFDDADRLRIMKRWPKMKGKIIKFKYQEVIAKTGKPRLPIYLGERMKEDVS